MIAKRYIPELGSKWVQEVVAPDTGNSIVICQLTQVEMFSVLERHQHDGILSEPEKVMLQSRFLADVRQEYLMVIVTEQVYEQARAVVSRHRLRALDAVQLASAMQFAKVYDYPVTFVSADKRLLLAAQAEGFQTDNPLDHL